MSSQVFEPAPGLGKIATVFACGSALFSDGYVNAASGPVRYILSTMYPEQWSAKNNSKLFSSMVFAGTVLGQLVFGYLVDRYGRRPGMIFASLWLALFSLISGVAYGAGGSIQGLFTALIAYRFLLGIGIGAEYPAGTVACAENTEDPGVNKKHQQKLVILSTNTMIDLGFVIANFVPYLLLQIFTEERLEWVWRLTLGLGAVFPLAVLFFRMSMREPEHYQQNSMSRIKFHKLPWGLIFRKYGLRLLGVSIAWAAYDWVAYPGSIYSSVIISGAIPEGTMSQVLGWDVLTNAFYLPGTIIGAFVADKLGPKRTIILGLLLQSLVGFLLSGVYTKLKQHIAGFAIMYGLYLSLGELGPGNNLGLLAAKATGPTAVRGVFYSIAAAIGKIFAFIASYVYEPIIADVGGSGTYRGDTIPVYIGSALGLFSAAVVYFLVPDIRADFMKEEDERFRLYLEQAGYDTSGMGLAPLLEHDRTAASAKEEANGSLDPVEKKM
ncbi:MFS general substrate transporter [Cystobasidium minutum MCA 4210]|uniref:MFS general substrate transporter n=1 Tax=Cystobasidium minutum MCA 4210 TaxID=1397322 RepID=UPI0034CFEC5E|eukprot:jgi/Rhomi1/3317/CE3316_7809